MKKKIIIISILTVLLVIYFGINLKYINDMNKVDIEKEVTDKDLISKCIVEYFDLLKKGNYEEAYSKLKDSKYSNLDSFKSYVSTEIVGENNLITVLECEKNNGKYEAKVKVSPPLFISNEELKKKIYKEKQMKIEINFNGIFDYKIYKFEKVEE